MNVQDKITATEKDKDASCTLLWIAGERGNSLTRSLGLTLEQQIAPQMICAARNARVHALLSAGKQFLKTHGLYCFKMALSECCYLRTRHRKAIAC